MDRSNSKAIVSLTKLLRIVNVIDMLVPFVGILVSITLSILFDYFANENSLETELTHDEYSEDYNAISHVKEILTLGCYYLFMVVRMGLSLLLWKGRVQRDLYKLKIWVVISVLLTLTGCCICFLTWLERVSHIGVVVGIMVILLIVSIFSTSVVIYFICKYTSGEIFDFDECMALRFEPRENTAQQQQANM